MVSSSFAEQRVAVQLGAGIPTQPNGFSGTHSEGFLGGLQYLYELMPQLSVGIEANELFFPYKKNRNDSSKETMTSIITGEAIARYNFLQSKTETPYIQAGVGANRFREDQKITLLGGEIKTHDQTVRMSESLGIGMDVPVTDCIIAGINGTWHWFETGHAEFGMSVISMPTISFQVGYKIP
jgi:hypothetical protein